MLLRTQIEKAKRIINDSFKMEDGSIGSSDFSRLRSLHNLTLGSTKNQKATFDIRKIQRIETNRRQ